MKIETEEEKIKAVEKVLGEPAFMEFSANVWKVRTSLMIASVISLTMVLADLHIAPDSTVIGLKFNGLNDSVIATVLFTITAYFLMHFIWSAADNFFEWRLRVTGTKVSFITGATFGSGEKDYPSDPRQSTLYYWWKDQARKIGSMGDQISQIKNQLEGLNTQLTVRSKNYPETANIAREISAARDAISKLSNAMDQSQRTIASLRIPVSLQRFDDCFHFFLKSQNLRWLLIEFALTIVIGIYALVRLWLKLSPI